jgi:gentisate 1,2-dioxygenase
MSIFDYVAAPNLPGPPLHRHRTIEEAFYILDGEVEFTVEGRRERLGAGGLAYVPAGIAHTFAIVGDAPARWLGVITPGAGLALLEGLGQLLRSGPPDPERLAALFAAHDTEIVA